MIKIGEAVSASPQSVGNPFAGGASQSSAVRGRRNKFKIRHLGGHAPEKWRFS